MQADPSYSQNPLLALEVRPRITGFAVFQPPSHLLDYGLRKHGVARDDVAQVTAKKIGALLDLHQPSIIIVRARRVYSREARNDIGILLRVVRREATHRSIAFQAIRAEVVCEFFASYQCTSKHQRAVVIARRFPELSWKLPPERKKWKSEDRRMLVFDAAATALAFMNRSPPTKG